jgi:hypothetical protein
MRSGWPVMYVSWSTTASKRDAEELRRERRQARQRFHHPSSSSVQTWDDPVYRTQEGCVDAIKASHNVIPIKQEWKGQLMAA